jgi:hypothetical protein
MVVAVVMQMAALAHCPKVVVVAMFRYVIQVGRRQDNPGSGAVRRPAVDVRAAADVRPPAAFPHTFASAGRTNELDAVSYRRPIGRVSGAVFGSNRHLFHQIVVVVHLRPGRGPGPFDIGQQVP